MAGVPWWRSRPRQRRDAKWSHCLAQVKHTGQRMAHSNTHTGLLLWRASGVLLVHSLSHRIHYTSHRERLIWQLEAQTPAGSNTDLEEPFPKTIQRLFRSLHQCKHHWTGSKLVLLVLKHLLRNWHNQGHHILTLAKSKEQQHIFLLNLITVHQIEVKQLVNPWKNNQQLILV